VCAFLLSTVCRVASAFRPTCAFVSDRGSVSPGTVEEPTEQSCGHRILPETPERPDVLVFLGSSFSSAHLSKLVASEGDGRIVALRDDWPPQIRHFDSDGPFNDDNGPPDERNILVVVVIMKHNLGTYRFASPR
jgi:hypothetical protein